MPGVGWRGGSDLFAMPPVVLIAATSDQDGSLMRVGTQLVRGEYLTGAEVGAPPWVPEYHSPVN